MKSWIRFGALAALFFAQESPAALKSVPPSGGHFSEACTNASGSVTSSMNVVTLHMDDNSTLTLYPSDLNADDAEKAEIVSADIQTLEQKTMQGACGPSGSTAEVVRQLTIRQANPRTGDASLDQELKNGLTAFVICSTSSFGSPVPCHKPVGK